MSKIESLMKELNLKPETIENALSKINKIVNNHYEIDSGKFYFTDLGGNGDGNN